MGDKSRGTSLIEILTVLFICTILVFPLINFLVTTRKNAYKGLDRLESLTSARIILEKVQRDIKVLCLTEKIGFLANDSPEKGFFRFPIFPSPAYGSIPMRNPVNLVTYEFDKKKKILERKVNIHSLFMKPNADISEIIGKNVVLFSISRKRMFETNFYQIEVKCESPHPQRKETAYLRTAMGSEFEARLFRNSHQLLNRASFLESPE